jgi:hypothetical protein
MAVSSDIMTSCTLGVGMLKAANLLDASLDNLLGDQRPARRRPASKASSEPASANA